MYNDTFCIPFSPYDMYHNFSSFRDHRLMFDGCRELRSDIDKYIIDRVLMARFCRKPDERSHNTYGDEEMAPYSEITSADFSAVVRALT